MSSDNPAGSPGHRDPLPGLGSVEGSVPPGQVVAIDPDLGENGTLVYSIQPPNKFYHISSSTGKIRTTHIMLDRENPDPHEAELMRKIDQRSYFLPTLWVSITPFSLPQSLLHKLME